MAILDVLIVSQSVCIENSSPVLLTIFELEVMDKSNKLLAYKRVKILPLVLDAVHEVFSHYCSQRKLIIQSELVNAVVAISIASVN